MRSAANSLVSSLRCGRTAVVGLECTPTRRRHGYRLSMPRVSVIVVSFNTREKLRRCLQCIEPHHEILVVDNASEDGSAEMVRTDFPTSASSRAQRT